MPWFIALASTVFNRCILQWAVDEAFQPPLAFARYSFVNDGTMPHPFPKCENYNHRSKVVCDTRGRVRSCYGPPSLH